MTWKQLIHHGVSLPPEYKHKGYVTYPAGKKLLLKKDVEEYLVYWFQLSDNNQSDSTILKNFLYCIRRIQSNIDESFLKNKKVKEQFKLLSKNFVSSPKVSNEVIMDGKILKVNNTIERPSIFIGRGNHPLRGMVKSRIGYNDIMINWSGSKKGPGGKSWNKVVCDNDATWIACWKDTLTNKMKYIHLISIDNKNKFTDAQKLKTKLTGILNKISIDMSSKNDSIRQMSIIVYLIYRTGIRVGHEKDEKTSDSVGCCTLNVENIKLTPGYNIELKFNGKDYIPFHTKLKVTPKCHSALKNIISSKNPNDQIFNVSASNVNDYLGKLMPGLTAKVFRTYKASSICHDALKDKKGIDVLKEAFVKVANFCNHKKMLKGEYVTEAGTCKKNYIDPRIVFSYCKRCSLNISDVYSPELQRIHEWASLTPKNFVY